MTLPELLQKARELAAAEYVYQKDVESIELALGRAEAALNLQRYATKEYAKDENSARKAIDGRARTLEMWEAIESLLSEAEEAELEALGNMQALTAELRRLVVLGTHRTLKAQRVEART